MATTKNPPSPLFGRLPDARQAVREVSNDLIATIRAMRSPAKSRSTSRADFPMRLLAAVVQAHVSTDCIVGYAVPIPAVMHEPVELVHDVAAALPSKRRPQPRVR